MNNMSFYNTIKAEGETLKSYRAKADNQDCIIMNIFNNNNKLLTPDEVLNLWPENKPPLTSIRRSITNLTNKGMLIKTDMMRLGNYGKLTHCWRLPTGQIKLF